MNNTLFASEFLKALDEETTASRKCLERIPEHLFAWKPHEKSMAMGYLALLVAEIPKWISYVIQKGEIDFATFEHYSAKTPAELVKHFDENLKSARESLQNASEEMLSGSFHLKNQGQTLFSSSKMETIAQSIRHMVHHRGQLTVYMRLNDIPVPSIYGPSADDRTF